MKRCLPICKHKLFGKIQWTIITWEKNFYSHLNMKNITDGDYIHAKRVCKDFGIKRIRWIPWFVCSKWSIIATWCFYQLSGYGFWNIWTWSCSFLFCNRTSMASSLKNAKVKLDLWADIDKLLMAKKVSEVKYVMLFIDVQKLITNTWKIMIKIKDCHILSIVM